MPTTGHRGADVETETHAFELKSRSSLPDWVHHAWEQAEESARMVGKVPVVVLEERRAGGRNVRYYLQEEKIWLAGLDG